jgi:hypothetical protein
MIDAVTVVGLFADIFKATKQWREPKVERVGHLYDMDREEVVIGLRAEGHELDDLHGSFSTTDLVAQA